MKLTYSVKSLAHTIESILWFQRDDKSPFWKEALFRCYPQFNREMLKAPFAERKVYLSEKLTELYQKESKVFDDKVVECNTQWSSRQTEIERAFSDAFQVDFSQKLNDMKGFVSLNPICPRYLDSTSFDLFYKQDRSLDLALHEIVHFAWFDVWQTHFKDDAKEYNTPHLKWILSEMVVDIFANHSALKTIFSEVARKETVYRYFYTLKIEGDFILNHLAKMYRNAHLTDFMEQAWAFCQAHETFIRSHIEQSENKS